MEGRAQGLEAHQAWEEGGRAKPRCLQAGLQRRVSGRRAVGRGCLMGGAGGAHWGGLGSQEAVDSSDPVSSRTAPEQGDRTSLDDAAGLLVPPAPEAVLTTPVRFAVGDGRPQAVSSALLLRDSKGLWGQGQGPAAEAHLALPSPLPLRPGPQSLLWNPGLWPQSNFPFLRKEGAESW